jgi:hypothetical protein
VKIQSIDSPIQTGVVVTQTRDSNIRFYIPPQIAYDKRQRRMKRRKAEVGGKTEEKEKDGCTEDE